MAKLPLNRSLLEADITEMIAATEDVKRTVEDMRNRKDKIREESY